MKLRYLAIMAMLFATAILFAQATDLFISEYVEGTSYNKAIEIYNGTGLPVDLSQYTLKKQTNGAGAFASDLVLSGTLANDDVYVIVSNASGGTNLAGQPFVDLPTASQACNFNGNDAIALYKNGVQLDLVGPIDDPTIWGANMTLVRLPTVASPTTTFSFAQWTQYPVDTFSYLGDHTFSGGGTEPVIIINAPNGGETWYREQTRTISWGSANVTGNVKIELDNNGTLSTLAADVPNSGSWTWVIANSIALGTQYKVKVSKLDGSVFDVSDNFFAISEIVTNNVANIAALRAGLTDGITNYHLTGEVFLSYQQTYRNKKYIQDSTGAIEIDDVAGIITTPYQIGDGITGFTFTMIAYHNLLQATPVSDPGATSSTGHVFEPQNVTINELNTNFENYESELITLNDVEFEDTTAPFATGVNYNISDPTGTIVFRTSFFDADYIGQAIPTGGISMNVICAQYDAAYQVTARTSADFGPVAVDEYLDNAAPISIVNAYPNPSNSGNQLLFTLKNASPVSVLIYNNKGQLVRNLGDRAYPAGSHQINWNSLDDQGNAVSTGVYFFKISSGKFTSSKKMILIR